MNWPAYIAIFVFVVVLFGLFRLSQRQVSFNLRVLVSLVLGVCGGLLLQLCFKGTAPSNLKIVNQSLNLVGSIYIDLLMMLVIPLVLTSIIHSILNLSQSRSQAVGKMAGSAVVMILVLTGLSAAIGMGVGIWFHVGHGMTLPAAHMHPEHQYTGFVSTILGMIPSNPVTAMEQGNMIAVVIFAVFIGLAGLMLEKVDAEKAVAFKAFMTSAFHVMKKLASLVIALTPYGVFALLARVTAESGSGTLSGLANFLLAMYVAMFFVIVMHSVILLVQGKNIFKHYAHVYAPLLVAFTTRSSFGTLPVAEETLKNKLGLKQMTASFAPSMGATIGMNACAGVFPAMLVVTAMTILHQPITLSTVFIVMFINALASLGVSGVPGTAFVAAGVSLSALGLPYSVIALIQGIDPILDMGRTATNVNGMITTAVTVDPLLKDASQHSTASEKAVLSHEI
jgi:L-cystine uptake protein TcyP (sodium:dicarboxylate symporter family)